MASLDPYLKLVVSRQALKLALVPGARPCMQSHNGSKELGQPVSTGQIDAVMYELLSEVERALYNERRPLIGQYATDEFRFQFQVRHGAKGPEVDFINQTLMAQTFIPLSEAETVPAAPETAAALLPIDRLLLLMPKLKASDLHLCAGCRPYFRINGDLSEQPVGQAFSDGELQDLLFQIIGDTERSDFATKGSCDFAREVAGVGRFRFNVFKEARGMAAAVRLIPQELLSAEQLRLPKAARLLASLPKGLVLVTGPTGSGKSTTLAAVLDLVNRTRNEHILTLEAPIEFRHPNKKCLVQQREVGRHTNNFKDALRDALREDPDVVLLGEMRDLETIAAAIETANTGHLVFGTLHTATAIGTVNRIIDIFPADQQKQVRAALAESLKAVISQTLLKRKGGGRVAVQEVLIVTPSVAALIREQKVHQIANMMQTGREIGMQTLNDELLRLVREGTVEPLEAYRKAPERGELLRAFASNAVVFTPPLDLETIS